MSSNDSSPSSSSVALRTARLASVSQRQRLLSISALSVDEEIRRSEGGGFAIPMDGPPGGVVQGGAVGRVKGDADFEPIHKRRGSLPRYQPDPSLRPPPSPNSSARKLSSSPVREGGGSDSIPSSPSTFNSAYSVSRPRGPSSPLSTPTSEYPPDAFGPSVSPASKYRPLPSQGYAFPLPIPSPSIPLPAPPASTNTVDPREPSKPLPTLRVSTAPTSPPKVGPPPAEPLPSVPRAVVVPRGPSAFRGLGRRPSTSGTPSPTREIFWGGQGGTTRRGSAAVTPGTSPVDGDQMAITPGGSIKYFRSQPSPLGGEFKLNVNKMLGLRARGATPKQEGGSDYFSQSQATVPRSCPHLNSPLPSPPLQASPEIRVGPPTNQHETGLALLRSATQPILDMTKAESPVDRSYRSSSFSMASANSASSGLSNSSSVTAYTSALDTPSTADTFNAQQPPKPHLTVSKPPHLSTVPSETTKFERHSVPLITETVHSDTEEQEDGTVPPLPDMRSRTSSSASSSGSPRDKMARKRRASGQGALKLSLTDDERIAKAQSKIVNLPGRDVDSDDDVDLLASYTNSSSSSYRMSDGGLSRKSSTPSLVADLRKGSTASYRSFSSTRSEPFAYDDGWSGSDDSGDDSIPVPKPRTSFSRSSSGSALGVPPIPAFPRRPSAQDLISSFPVPPEEPESSTMDVVPGRSSSLPLPPSSPNASLRSTASSATARPLSHPNARSSYLARPESTASGYFPSLSPENSSKPARPSSIFSISGDGGLVSKEGKVLPRPKHLDSSMWGDVEIAYEGSEGAASTKVAADKPLRNWEQAAEKLSDRNKALGRRESASSSASGRSQASHTSSQRSGGSVAIPSRVAAGPPSSMRSVAVAPSRVPAPQTSAFSPPSKQILIRKAPSSSSQGRSPAATTSRLPSPAVRKNSTAYYPHQRSPYGSASNSPVAANNSIDLPAIEPLRITKSRTSSGSSGPPSQFPLSASSIPSPVKNKPLPTMPGASGRLKPSGLPTRAAPRQPSFTNELGSTTSSSKSTTPTSVPTPLPPSRCRTPTPPVLDALAPVDPAEEPKSPKPPAFGPASGRRMSKLPSTTAPSRPSKQQHHQFYAAPPLPPLPMLPPALASQR